MSPVEHRPPFWCVPLPSLCPTLSAFLSCGVQEIILTATPAAMAVTTTSPTTATTTTMVTTTHHVFWLALPPPSSTTATTRYPGSQRPIINNVGKPDTTTTTINAVVENRVYTSSVLLRTVTLVFAGITMFWCTGCIYAARRPLRHGGRVLPSQPETLGFWRRLLAVWSLGLVRNRTASCCMIGVPPTLAVAVVCWVLGRLPCGLYSVKVSLFCPVSRGTVVD